VPVAGYVGVGDAEYRRRIRAWTMYDWANSAFSTTILAAVLPIYYSAVAGETLPSEAVATEYWTISLSIALFLVALVSPILGTISDLRRGKKPMLAISAGVGIVATGLLALAGSGDWLLASVFFVVGRIGFGASLIFYDALLPHVARQEDQNRVSSLGYAMGYAGGGILLAINAVMIVLLGDIPGSRWSFVSVAVWWAVFSIPVLRRVPEPPAVTARLSPGGLVTASFRRMGETLRHLRQYRHLARFLVAFLIYSDGIGTIIAVAAIYGTELGFDATELILALLLVQFVGMPFTLMFGSIPDDTPGHERRRAAFVAFVVFNLVALPLVGMIGGRVLAADLVGRSRPDFAATAGHVGQGEYEMTDAGITFDGAWEVRGRGDLGRGAKSDYAFTSAPGSEVSLAFHGREVEITYGRGPDHGVVEVLIDHAAALDDDGEPLTIDGYNAAVRYEERVPVDAGADGEHLLTLRVTAERNPDSTGSATAIGGLEVLPPMRESNLGAILGMLLALEAVGALFALALGRPLFGRFAGRLDTKRTLLLALCLYVVVAVWGFVLDAVLEFWFLAWMVAIVQGASQALSRSLYAGMCPAPLSGEFFGFFSIMEKFSSFFGPLLFAAAVMIFGSSRPAVLSVIAFFAVGGWLLARVDVEEGRRAAREAEQALAGEVEG
jgi:MFS-type transporter involved in bile tolerance (Atg22 family)